MDARAVSHFGSGKIADRAIAPDGSIRLALNHPPPVRDVFDPIVTEALNRVFAETPPSNLMATHRWMGTEKDRQAGAAFVARRLGHSPDPDRIIITHSTQAAVHMLLPSIVGDPRPLAVEQMSYPPVRSFAARYGIPVVDVAIDGEGLDPDAFEQTCRRDRPAALYLLSTFQNPTTVTILSAGERKSLRSHAGTRFSLLKMISTACWRRHRFPPSHLSHQSFPGIYSARQRAFQRALSWHSSSRQMELTPREPSGPAFGQRIGWRPR